MRTVVNAINNVFLMLRSDPAQPERVSKHEMRFMQWILAQPLAGPRINSGRYPRQKRIPTFRRDGSRVGDTATAKT